MSDRRVTAVYGRALFGAAREMNRVDAVLEELTRFEQAVKTVPGLNQLWLHMRLPADTKNTILREALESGISPLTLNFLAVLARHRRERYLPAILERFSELVRRDRGRAGVRVSSAVPLSEPLRKELQALAESVAGLETETEFAVNPELLGGVVLRVGDCVADVSLRGRLERLRRAFAAGSEVTGHQS